MGLLQMAGAVVAIPVGLAGAYTTYQANFSPETSCQNLRAGIIATLDKNVEAATRRMLVRRDVQTFEQSCAGFDPDAAAAFKSLLAVDKVAPAVAAVPRAETPAKEAARKPEPRPETVVAKPAAVNPAPVVVAAPARKDAAASDANWLAAVRGALVDHEPEKPKAMEAAVAPVVAAPPPAPLTKPSSENVALRHEPAAPPPAVMSAPPVVTALPPAEAPALPPATSVPATAPVAVAPVEKPDPNRPVPPAPIPGAQPLSLEPKAPESGRSRLGDLIADIPLLGRVIDPKGN